MNALDLGANAALSPLNPNPVTIYTNIANSSKFDVGCLSIHMCKSTNCDKSNAEQLQFAIINVEFQH